MKTLIFLLVAFAASAFANWDGSSSEPKNTREIDGKVFYEISSPEELAWFAEQVNGGKTTLNAVLVNDIKFMDDTSKTSSVNWTLIGKDSTVMFNGIFDGLGYTIYGLYCSNGKTRFAGIFGVTDRESMIKNIKSAKSLINATNGVFWNGGIVGLNNGTIVGCTNSGLVNNNYYYENYTAGGVVGINSGAVIGCTNIGSIFFGGGVVGSNIGIVSYCTNRGSVLGAGIVWRNYGSVINCTNNGMISGSSNFTIDVAGVVSDNYGSVINCTNNGMISDSSRFSIGGVVAFNDNIVDYNFCTVAFGYNACALNNVERGRVSRCTNNGKVVSFSSNSFSVAGGIVGLQGDGVIANCRNFGQVYANNPGGLVGGFSSDSATLYNSYSTVVGVCGLNCVYKRIVNCFYNSDNSTENKYDSVDIGIIGLSSADMQSDRFAWILNTTNGTDTNSGIWGRERIGYPIFADSTHNPINSMYYEPIYKVIFKVNLISLVRYSNFQGLVDFPEAPEIPWKMFLGWFDENGNKVSPETIFTKERTLTAVYSDLSGLGSKYRPAPAWNVTAAGRDFQFHAAPVGQSYALFDLQGKVLVKGRIENSEMKISAPRAGSYIVRIGERSVRVNAK